MVVFNPTSLVRWRAVLEEDARSVLKIAVLGGYAAPIAQDIAVTYRRICYNFYSRRPLDAKT